MKVWLTIDRVIIVELLRIVLLFELVRRIFEALSIVRALKKMFFPDVLLAGNQTWGCLSDTPSEL